jgi:hypothetical protein
MHRTIKSGPHHLPDAARIIAVRLVDLRLQHRLQCRVSTQTTGKPASNLISPIKRNGTNQMLPFSPSEDVNFVVPSSNPSIAHFPPGRSTSRGLTRQRVYLSPSRICLERSPKRELRRILPRIL